MKDFGDAKIGAWIYRAYERNKRTINIISVLTGIVVGTLTILKMLL